MKKFKNLMLMLTLALVFVGAVSVTKASAAEATTNIVYDQEYITIDGAGSQVYYQVVKDSNGTGLKPASWIPAAEKKGSYYIDFSATSNTKDAYIAWTTDNEAESGTVITVDAKIKSLKVTLNYAAETVPENVGGLDNIISKVVVKGIEPTEDNAEGKPGKYGFMWKRGANGAWKPEASFTQLDWDMVKASNATLYISIAAGDGKEDCTMEKYAYRASKEAKVKIPKAAKAPNVKIDFVKGTVALKNGMQVREVGKDAWLNVSPYSKTEEKNTEIFNADATVVTKTKVSTVLVGDLVTALKTEVEDGKELNLEVRTAATDKKFPSNIGTLKFNTPAQNPSVAGVADEPVALTYTKADKTAKVAAEFTINFADIMNVGKDAKFDTYEYVLVKVAADEVDFSKQKWTKMPADGVLDLASKIGKEYKYTKKDGTSVTAKYEETTAIYIRKAADKANSLFPSAMGKSIVAITEAKVYGITVTENANVEVSYKVGEGTALKAKKGDTVTVTCTVAEGYENLTVTVKKGDATVEVKNTDGVYTFTMPEGDVTITTAVTAKAAAGEGA